MKMLPAAITLVLAPLLALAMTAAVHHGFFDNPVKNARKHVEDNRTAITQLVERTALERHNLAVATDQPPREYYEGNLNAISPEKEHSTTVHLDFRLDPPGSGAITARYIVEHHVTGGQFRHLIPGENYRLKDAHLDAGSIMTRQQRPVRLEHIRPRVGRTSSPLTQETIPRKAAAQRMSTPTPTRE